MVLDFDIVYSLLDRLDETVRLTRQMQLVRESYLVSKDLQHLLERRLHIIIEKCIDLANHVVSGLRLGRRETSRELFAALHEQRIISAELADKLKAAAAFRNLLVHEYAKLDSGRVFDYYLTNLDDLTEFARAVFSFVDRSRAGQS